VAIEINDIFKKKKRGLSACFIVCVIPKGKDSLQGKGKYYYYFFSKRLLESYPLDIFRRLVSLLESVLSNILSILLYAFIDSVRQQIIDIFM
jgi:hypothetical protein